MNSLKKLLVADYIWTPEFEVRYTQFILHDILNKLCKINITMLHTLLYHIIQYTTAHYPTLNPLLLDNTHYTIQTLH